MSTALGIAAVTAVIESSLNSVFNPGAGLGGVKVTALAPDVIQAGLDTGATPNQVNVFLHQVTPNAGWRNAAMPNLGPDGRTALRNQPLALDLHYLLTAYTPEDGFAEALLGFALLTLHDNPTLSRAQITAALASLPGSHPLFAALQTTGLADQIELLKITPDTLGREEMAWIWTALKADYRPTYAFRVSVVLIERAAATVLPLPVLSRNITVQPGPAPVLLEVQMPDRQASATIGDTVMLLGETLAATTRVRIANQRFGFVYQPDIVPSAIGGNSVSFVVPNDPTKLPAGIYSVAALVTDAGNNILQSTNRLSFGIAPKLRPAPPPVAVNTPQGTLVTVHFDPFAQSRQAIALAMGGAAVAPQAFAADTDTLSFLFPAPGLTSGPYVARLQVDGVDSPVTWTASPPAFTAPVVNVP
jgi:hypothetical protein